MFVHRANANIGDTDKSKVGILLIGHGQPDEWDVEWPTETEQELSFRNDVIELLVADGYKRENISLAWMEFKDPKPVEIIYSFLKTESKKYSSFQLLSVRIRCTANTITLSWFMSLIFLRDSRSSIWEPGMMIPL